MVYIEVQGLLLFVSLDLHVQCFNNFFKTIYFFLNKLNDFEPLSKISHICVGKFFKCLRFHCSINIRCLNSPKIFMCLCTK